MNRVLATIDLQGLKYNFFRVKAIAPQSSVLAMVKSNGYGHGLVRVAKTLTLANAFGVSCIDEALVLRNNGIKVPIVVMRGFNDKTELSECIRHDLLVVIHHFHQINLLEKNKNFSAVQIWLKIDTGMHRLGFSLKDVERAYNRLFACLSVRKPIRLMTHLANADSKDRSFTEWQIRQFAKITTDKYVPKSVVNSAGLLAYPTAFFDWVRPGIMLYGVSPFSWETGITRDLKPVMTLSAKIISIRNCRPGDTVGYGCTWCASDNTPIGIVSIGYGDGYLRHTPIGTPTLLNGKLCPLIGRVSMDMIAIDLSLAPNARIGNEVILWGNGLPVEKIAKRIGTIGYELLCKINQRIEFREKEK
ncbi:alanine racemase [Coxiella endosymbiont of Amblyomma americanum]|uniref:alanine racemase n=1 Tax=Coxiella endosymbiont of Amblyomma americanum TaxID=325775 RepID=UPI00057FFA08|nr:alanine racemase [Coxiella endosymbiont of Amblyomma americanum]AJC50561.1 alanine racemase [Coxiella endosymbiont of Amblyomma americanum]AUJ58894.1 alanine racemase [Coxiella-like endosymbiont of Amblyomma americanum]